MKKQLELIDLKIYIIILCVLDYIFTYIGIKFNYVLELNPLMNIFFNNNQYLLGFIFKMLLTAICLEILCLKIFNDRIIMLKYIYCLYLSINSLHILYFILWIL